MAEDKKDNKPEAKKEEKHVMKSDVLHSGKSYKKGHVIKKEDEAFEHFKKLGHIKLVEADVEVPASAPKAKA